MKSLLPLLSLLVIFASCSTAYRSGQTPDDVYFSPARPQQEYVEVRDRDDRPSYRRNDEAYYRNEEAYYNTNEDRYIRMRIRNRDRWDYLDNYYRDPYAYNYKSTYYYNQYGYSNPRSYWNSYYNPYSGHVVIVNPRAATPNRPRTYNLRVYDPQTNGNTNSKVSGSNSRRSSTAPSNTTRNSGNELRDVFRSSDNSSAPSKPASTQSSSGNSSSSSSSSSGSTSAPKRKS